VNQLTETALWAAGFIATILSITYLVTHVILGF
jgi:hypothetical protein